MEIIYESEEVRYAFLPFIFNLCDNFTRIPQTTFQLSSNNQSSDIGPERLKRLFLSIVFFVLFFFSLLKAHCKHPVWKRAALWPKAKTHQLFPYYLRPPYIKWSRGSSCRHGQRARVYLFLKSCKPSGCQEKLRGNFFFFSSLCLSTWSSLSDWVSHFLIHCGNDYFFCRELMFVAAWI